MANEFFTVTVASKTGARLELELAVNDPSQAVPVTAGWALMTLHEATWTSLASAETAAAAKERQRSPLARELKGRDLETVCREPGTWVKRFTVKKRSKSKGSYLVEVTDPKWVEHLTPGMRFDSTSYGVDEPEPPIVVKNKDVRAMLEALTSADPKSRKSGFKAYLTLKENLGHTFDVATAGAERPLARGLVAQISASLDKKMFNEVTPALRGLDSISGAVAVRQFAPVLERLFVELHPVSDGWFAVAEVLRAPQLVDACRPALVRLLEHENIAVRCRALSALATSNDKAVVPLLKKQLGAVKKGAAGASRDKMTWTQALEDLQAGLARLS